MLIKGTDYKVTYTDNTNAGTAKVKITGINGYKGTINKTFTIKATVSKEQGTARFKKVSGNSKLTISSDGKVTVKKGLVKGKTYTLQYKVRNRATRNYKATEVVTGTVKIKIK